MKLPLEKFPARTDELPMGIGCFDEWGIQRDENLQILMVETHNRQEREGFLERERRGEYVRERDEEFPVEPGIYIKPSVGTSDTSSEVSPNRRNNDREPLSEDPTCRRNIRYLRKLEGSEEGIGSSV